ncbi:MAG: hypothetical protein KF891_19680 [Rhizobacter sp.]|nr:hypothetical protein [Rhizobacter sp.]
MPNDKPSWIGRFAAHLGMLQPDEPVGLLPEIAETFWYYHRHRTPEEAAQARAEGRLRLRGRREAWIDACSAAICALDPQLQGEDTRALATTLWEEDWARSVDPYVMAQALWDQAVLLAHQGEGGAEHPLDLFSLLRPQGPAR